MESLVFGEVSISCSKCFPDLPSLSGVIFWPLDTPPPTTTTRFKIGYYIMSYSKNLRVFVTRKDPLRWSLLLLLSL